jgi:host factor-I protein
MNTPGNDRKELAEKGLQNIQESFLNGVRKEKSSVTIYLMSGIKLTGRIRSFDKFSLILENNHQEQLIFKHAISTVIVNRSQAAPAPATNATTEGKDS